MSRKLTVEDFISKATEKHGFKYFYGEVNYVNSRTKVTIVCSKHGEFQQTPSNHLQGAGCKSCAIEALADTKRATVEDFISKATEKHGPKYSYDEVMFVNTRTKVTIKCSHHGPFEQEPSSHLKGTGCPSCAIESKADTLRATVEDFIHKATLIHGVRYSYDEVNYVNSATKVKIVCSHHGPFEQRPNNHLDGAGCKSCATEANGDAQRATVEDFISKATEKHGSEYSYDEVDYVNNCTKVKIVCQAHGPFEQEPSSHLHGAGCPSCAEYGFNPDKPAFLYILRATKFNMMKIGIAKDVDKRLQTLRRETPFSFELVATKEFTKGGDAFDMEQSLHRVYESAGQEGFDGATEWFEWDDTVLVGLR